MQLVYILMAQATDSKWEADAYYLQCNMNLAGDCQHIPFNSWQQMTLLHCLAFNRGDIFPIAWCVVTFWELKRKT